MLSASMDLAYMAKWDDLNPLKKSEIPTKYNCVFLTND